ncbi:MAG: hypothetical protein DRJ65_19865, partial [Acidobacteria bacterium]
MAGAIRIIRLTLSAAEIRRGVRSVNKSLLSIDKTTKRLQKSVSLLTKMYGALFALGLAEGAASFAIELGKSAEAADLMSRKLVQLTGDANAMMVVLEGADRVGIDFDELGKIVGRFGVATDKAFSVDTMTGWAEGLVLAARSIGASQQEINSAVLQFSQALGSNVLQGEEFRAVNESLVPLMTEIADVLGVARTELKSYAKQGVITTEVMTKALKQLEDTMSGFSGLTDTLDAELSRVKNQWTLLVGNFVGSDNIIRDVVEGINKLLKEINTNFVLIQFTASYVFDDIVRWFALWNEELKFNIALLDLSVLGLEAFIAVGSDLDLLAAFRDFPTNFATMIQIALGEYLKFDVEMNRITAKLWETLKHGWSQLGDFINKIWINIRVQFAKMSDWIINKFADLLNKVGGGLQDTSFFAFEGTQL